MDFFEMIFKKNIKYIGFNSEMIKGEFKILLYFLFKRWLSCIRFFLVVNFIFDVESDYGFFDI